MFVHRKIWLPNVCKQMNKQANRTRGTELDKQFYKQHLPNNRVIESQGY